MTPVILFPHSHITVSDLNKTLARYENLTICRPWFMDDPFLPTEGIDMSAIRIQRPPETLKPEPDFITLISEYKIWLRQNRDKGYGAFLAASRQGAPSEETPWEIRQLISKAGAEGRRDSAEEQRFKWHLILHLAREVEENRLEAEQLLNKLKDQRSPLEGALEEAPPSRFFEKTPLMKSQLQLDDYHLRQVFEAWFGLFGEYLPDEGSLITLDPQVPIYASEVLETEETIIKPKKGPAKESSPEPAAGKGTQNVIRLPRLADGDKLLNDPVGKGLSGRMIILMED